MSNLLELRMTIVIFFSDEEGEGERILSDVI